MAQWRSVDMLGQVTGDEIGAALRGQAGLFHAEGWESGNVQSYLFFAVDLKPQANGAAYTRTQLAGATRAINKLFLMPALVIFRHGDSLTFAIIARRQHKRDPGKDVLEKVTLIKGIRCAQPHRAHLEILAELALQRLAEGKGIDSFAALQRAWEQVLDTAELNKKFYREVADWYFWATHNVTFPAGAEQDKDVRNATSVIRLITRLIFVWFLKEKGLVPETLFDREKLADVLTWDDPQGSTYYKAILQNLFFATLNTHRDADEKDEGKRRRFRGLNESGGRNSHYGIPNVYRYRRYFRAVEDKTALALFGDIPFLNGGLFECLDRREKVGKENAGNENLVVRIDGFSDRPDNTLVVPDALFFAEPQPVDLNTDYGTKGQSYRVRGLLHIFASYKFTVEENTPVEEEVALDPELLGKVFEDLLAVYNPETGETARKQTGSFYTPRNVVDYMVDESLLASLTSTLAEPGPPRDELQGKLRRLLAYTDEPHGLSQDETQRVIQAIDNLKVIDPACGSGAFPMGVLHKLVFMLRKLDPHNAGWQQRQIVKAEELSDPAARDAAVAAIRAVFAHGDNDYGRKLYLIENCIYGVDIQPVAVQIAKLRCFISLIVDQAEDHKQFNRGIRALPNLETKFVAADTLVQIERPVQMPFHNPEVERVEQQLGAVRRRHFDARSKDTKERCQQEDRQLRGELVTLLEHDGWPKATAGQLAGWDPYNQNAHAAFFDPEWMFGMTSGFDIVIGNPPYVRQEKIKARKPLLKQQYTCYIGTADLYVYFFERGLELLRASGILTYICSNKYFRSGYGERLRCYLGSETRIEQIIDFGNEPVFTAVAYPSVIITERQTVANNQMRVYTWPDQMPLDNFSEVFYANSFLMPQSELTGQGWRLETNGVLRLLETMRKVGKPLREYVDRKIFYGIKTGLNDAFIVDESVRDRLIAEHPSSEEVLKPFLRGRDIRRWQVDLASNWLLFIPWHFPLHNDPSITGASDIAEREFKLRYPAVYSHLFEFRDALAARDQTETGVRYEWYALQRWRSEYWHEFSNPKIIWRAVAEEARGFGYDFSGSLSTDTTYFLPTTDMSLLALLNSSMAKFFLDQTCDRVQAGYLRIKQVYIEQLPVPALSRSASARLDELATQILAVKANDVNADVSAWEAEIDRLVYELYGLTDEEIQIVKGQ